MLCLFSVAFQDKIGSCEEPKGHFAFQSPVFTAQFYQLLQFIDPFRNSFNNYIWFSIFTDLSDEVMCRNKSLQNRAGDVWLHHEGATGTLSLYIWTIISELTNTFCPATYVSFIVMWHNKTNPGRFSDWSKTKPCLPSKFLLRVFNLKNYSDLDK